MTGGVGVCIVGNGPLAVGCAEATLRAGHRVSVVVSRDPDVTRWAREHGIGHLDSVAGLPGHSAVGEFDFIFSLANGEILLPEILALPRRMAVNFHNGPLPRYAGVHVTSWAILNGETAYSATWHVVSPRIDAGDILAEPQVPISAADTTESLNRACRQAGIDSFPGLLRSLVHGSAKSATQDLSRRRYFSGKKKHESFGFLDWGAPAEELCRVVRAHTFGASPNGLGLPRLRIRGDIYVVLDLTVTGDISSSRPGTLARETGGVRIATATHDVRIARLRPLAGTPLGAGEVITSASLVDGDILPAPDAALREQLERVRRSEVTSASYWQANLKRTQPAGMAARTTLSLPAAMIEPLGGAERAWACAVLLTALSFCLHRQLPDLRVVGVSTPLTRRRNASYGALARSLLPLPLHGGEPAPFHQVLSLMARDLEQMDANAPCAADLPLRYPGRRLAKELVVQIYVTDQMEVHVQGATVSPSEYQRLIELNAHCLRRAPDSVDVDAGESRVSP